MNLTSQYLRVVVATGVVLVAGTACAPSHAAPNAVVRVVAIERVYGDLARQLGGSDVDVTTILNSPSADPHAYEPTPRDADAVAAADVVIVNGLGYDAFAQKLLAASPRMGRTVVEVGALGKHRVGDNPHVWYEPASIRAFTRAFSSELIRRNASDRAALESKRRALETWTGGLTSRLAALGKRHPSARVAITEPVFDYVLRAARITIATPESFSHAIEEGNDPAPQDVETMRDILSNRRVAAFVYNKQTVESSTARLLDVARSAHVPIVAITETLPANETTQAWMDREVTDLDRAL